MELVVVCVITVVLAAGLSNLFISGLRASSTANATLSSQSNLMYALSRLEFESRCASSAKLLSSGADVTLTLPAFCANAAGTFTWCVTSGSLVRYGGSACSGIGETFAASVTSLTPFSCIDTGTLPAPPGRPDLERRRHPQQPQPRDGRDRDRHDHVAKRRDVGRLRMMRRILQRLVREETGVALIMALAIVTILSVTTAGILLAGTANQREAYVSAEEREAFAIAQEGLAYAEGMLYYDSANGITLPVGTLALPTQPVGSGTYSASQTAGQTGLVGTGTVGGYTRTVKAQATPPLDVEVILDTSNSMQSTCTSSVTGISTTPEKIDCAKAGVQALLQGLWPCYSTLQSCGTATATGGGELGANVSNAVDEVGLMAFPALSSTTSRPYEIDCQSTDSISDTYPNPPSGSQPGYDIVGLSSDYRPSDFNATLNSTTSNLVESVDWGQCPGQAGSYSGSSNGSAIASGTHYYTVNAAGSGSTTSTANTITLSQAETLTGLTFDTSGTSSGYSYTATVGTVSGSTWTSTGLTCTSSGGNPCTSSGSISEPSGTKLNLKIVSGSGSGTRTGTWTVTYTGPAGLYPGGDFYGLKVIGGQGSYLAGAISEAQYLLDHAGRAGTTNAIIVLSDGELNSPHSWTDNTPCTTANNAATAAKNDGVLIYSIAYDSSGNCTDTSGSFHNATGITFMQDIASGSSTFFNQPSPGDLTTIFTHIAGDLTGLRFIG